MSRAIKRIKLTHKRVEPVHGDQEDDLRVRWMTRMSHYQADQLVFLDETVYSGCKINRRWG